MIETKNSPLLQELIERAGKICNEMGTTVTAEKLIIAMIEKMEDDGIGFAFQESELATAIGFLRNEGLDPAKLKAALLKEISGRKISPWDNVYYQTKMANAKQHALERNLAQLDVATLMEAFMVDPSSTMRKCFSTSRGEPAMEERMDWLRKNTDVFGGGAASPAGDSRKEAVARLIEKTKKMQEDLSKVVFGQDKAISVFVNGYFQGELRAMSEAEEEERKHPHSTFLFAGPPGVGKTLLAENIAKQLGLPYLRVDMSEYADKEAAIEFCGSDDVYKSAKKGNVTGFVEKNPKSVILFDEIEKAHITIIHLFLQMLDAGRLRDSNTDKQLSLADTVIIMTTNAGRQVYEDTDNGDLSGISRKVILKALEKDINPVTKAPFFPAAICSRFASGNVVMFNHITAHNLHHIARKTITERMKNFHENFGVEVTMDDAVPAALMFSEGGAADARTITGRAKSFFDDELYELFRLTANGAVSSGVQDINSIHISVDLPEDPDLLRFFRGTVKPDVLVFGDPQVTARLRPYGNLCNFIEVRTHEEGLAVLDQIDVSVVLLDMNKEGAGQLLNVEDLESASRDLLHTVRERFPDMPVYLLETAEKTYNSDEQISFRRHGVRGFISLDGANLSDELEDICQALYRQKSMNELAKSNKLINFETSQTLSADGKNAEIRLFDFSLEVAVDAEDSENILSALSKPTQRFADVYGAKDAKEELQYFVDYMKDPKKFAETGVQAPRGVLLYGPPGTGKTMLAKAMANESDATFIAAEGNQFLMKYVGEGPKKVHELFRTARKYAPSILFIDEIDAIAKERQGGDSGTAAAEATLTAFLTEMDGFKKNSSKPVFVLAATNFDVAPGGKKSLDPALMRRFDRRVYIDLPDREDRVRYIKQQTAKKGNFELSDDKIENIALRATGMSLADLESVIELSLRMTIRSGSGKVTDTLFDEAFETFTNGEKKNWGEEYLERVARHEAGHALMDYLNGDTPAYLTVVARGDHGGYMLPGEKRHTSKLSTREEMLARIRCALGGRAAELVCYGPENGISTGASGDLYNATRLAQNMLCHYGMDETFGPAVMDPNAPNSAELADQLRAAVNKILETELKKAVQILNEHRPMLDKLVETLKIKNHMTAAEIEALLQ